MVLKLTEWSREKFKFAEQFQHDGIYYGVTTIIDRTPYGKWVKSNEELSKEEVENMFIDFVKKYENNS